MIKSRAYYETEKWQSIKTKQKLHLFRSKELRVPLNVQNCVWVCRKKARLKYRHPAPKPVESDHLERLERLELIFSWPVTKTDTWIRTPPQLY